MVTGRLPRGTLVRDEDGYFGIVMGLFSEDGSEPEYDVFWGNGLHQSNIRKQLTPVVLPGSPALATFHEILRSDV